LNATSLLVVLWVGCVVTGLAAFLDYETTPGAAGAAHSDWPASSRLQIRRNGPELVMFVHPRCPCTRASLGELARLMADCQGLVTARVLFFKPADGEPGWEQTDLWRTATGIPGVEAIADEAGRERDLFGVETSGHVLLYDAAGHLRFSGGITASRGHSGNNAGREAISDLLRHGATDRDQTFVFGCPLRTR
jgi:hypothetical protein